MIKISLSHVMCVKFYEKFKIALILANTAGFFNIDGQYIFKCFFRKPRITHLDNDVVV